MMDITSILDGGTDFPATWKTLVRELLLKFEDGCTYHHDNICGNRPFHVDLKIVIDEPVNDTVDKQLHMQAKELEEGYLAINELLDSVYQFVGDSTKEEGLLKIKNLTERIKQETTTQSKKEEDEMIKNDREQNI